MEKSLSIVTSVFLAAMAAVIAGSVLLTITVQAHTTEVEEAAQRRISVEASKAMQLSASTLLEREWQSMFELAKRVDLNDYQLSRRFVDAVVGASDAVVWAGVVGVNGEIFAGSMTRREGDNVSGSGWFTEGLKEGNVESVLVAGSSDIKGASGGLINMSTPIKNEFGASEGVMIYSLEIDWMLQFLNSAAASLELDYQVRAGSGQLVMQQTGFVDAPFTDDMVPFAAGGYEITKLITLEGGEPYVATLLPNFIKGDMPNFEWDLTVRVPAQISGSGFLETLNSMRGILLGMAGIIAACAAFFAVAFLLPIHQLARQAQMIAKGKDIYPLETHSSREAWQLSDALAKLQSKTDKGNEEYGNFAGNIERHKPKLVI